jgi:uncharacterized protein DUF6909
MDRGLPQSASEEIELYMRTYYSLLRSSGEIQIKALIETHTQIDSSLHIHARDPFPDIAAFVYSTLRLPDCIKDVRLILLGQSDEVFEQAGYANLCDWQEVSAPGRRRKFYFDHKETLAAFIASASDIDDLIPILTALEIEWNKLNALLNQNEALDRLQKITARGDGLHAQERDDLTQAMQISPGDFATLENIWGSELAVKLLDIASHRKRFALRLLSGSLVDYRKATQRWWKHIESKAARVICDRPIYFVSSNTHCFPNLISGFGAAAEKELIAYVQDIRREDLLKEYQAIQKDQVPSSKENFLYYVMKKFISDPENAAAARAKERAEQEAGLAYIPSDRYLDLDAQIIELNCLIPERLDPRVRRDGLERLRQSRAIILNIDYPLGLAAYQVFSEVTQNVDQVKGFYLLGKSATLNGRIGDVTIPNVVYDEHSRNTYLFNNCFRADDVARNLIYGSVLDNQKAVSVKGTFLQNRKFLELFYREGYTDIEMEAGPYLSALYEMNYPRRYPVNEIARLYQTNLDIGILHYSSDTPNSRGKNLGAVHPSYYGMDPTYASAIAILRRIIEQETK